MQLVALSWEEYLRREHNHMSAPNVFVSRKYRALNVRQVTDTDRCQQLLGRFSNEGGISLQCNAQSGTLKDVTSDVMSPVRSSGECQHYSKFC